MRILLLASAFNSLTQRIFAELADRGHTLAVALAEGDDSVREAVRRNAPDLILAPMLKTAIPEDVWSARVCLIVHPGPPGDRGPSSLDWAIHEGAHHWGVTVLQAQAEMDCGDVWASAGFCLEPGVGKSDLYRNEVSDAALEAVLTAVERFAGGTWRPQPQNPAAVRVRPSFPQSARRIDWTSDSTETVLRALRAADSRPGVLDELLGDEWYLHGGHAEDRLRGRPGDLLATRTGALCRATADGAVWIPRLRPRRRPGERAGFALPATWALGKRLPKLPEVPAPLELPVHRTTWSDISYAEHGPVGFLHFSFPGGAMSTAQCRRLLAAYRFACTRPTSVLVLGGPRDLFGNGIHLGVIEAAADPAAESWANINAINDLVEAVLTTTDRLVVAALAGNAAAGGLMLALAADEVWCRTGAVLNPHYRLMGLPGSEYWTYTLPRRVGTDGAESLMADALPVSAACAHAIGLVDRLVPVSARQFAGAAAAWAADLADSPDLQRRIATKKAVREAEESARPLARYRAAELAAMHSVFFSPDASYHALRAAFVRNESAPEVHNSLRTTPQQPAPIVTDSQVCQI